MRAFVVRTQTLALASALFVGALTVPFPAHAQKKDYLTEAEADKIRDADTPSERIKLFTSFAADRIKKIQFEFAHPNELHRVDRINSFIDGYAGCIDDAAELIELGVDKQQDIRDAIKDMQNQAPDFLKYLKELSTKGTAVEPYKDNLDDAVDATADAIKDADEASKEIAPPPASRRPQ
jgi:hypothetical protein